MKKATPEELLAYFEAKARESKDPMVRAQQKWIDEAEEGTWFMLEVGEPERFAVQ